MGWCDWVNESRGLCRLDLGDENRELEAGDGEWKWGSCISSKSSLLAVGGGETIPIPGDLVPYSSAGIGICPNDGERGEGLFSDPLTLGVGDLVPVTFVDEERLVMTGFLSFEWKRTWAPLNRPTTPSQYPRYMSSASGICMSTTISSPVRNMRSSGFSATQSVNAVHLPIPPLAAKRVHRPRAFASITVIFYTCLAVLLGSSSLVKSWLVVMGIRNVWMPRSGCMHALISSRKPGVEKATTAVSGVFGRQSGTRNG